MINLSTVKTLHLRTALTIQPLNSQKGEIPDIKHFLTLNQVLQAEVHMITEFGVSHKDEYPTTQDIQ